MAESLEDNVGRRGVLPAAVCCLFLYYAFLSLSLSPSRTACFVERFTILTKDSRFGRLVQSCFEVPTRKGGERFANFHLQFFRWFVCFVFWRLRKKRCRSELCSSQLIEWEHHTNKQPTKQKGREEFELKQHLRQKRCVVEFGALLLPKLVGIAAGLLWALEEEERGKGRGGATRWSPQYEQWHVVSGTGCSCTCCWANLQCIVFFTQFLQ